MKNTPHEDDPNTNPQLTEFFFIGSEYIFHLDSTNRKFGNIIARALTNTKAYEPFFSKFNLFALTFHFLTPKEREINCSHEIMFQTKITHTYTYYKFKQKHYITNIPDSNPQHRFLLINSKYTSPYFLNFTFCIKSTNPHKIFLDYDPVRQMYIFCPLTNTFPIDDACKILISHSYEQPIELIQLEHIHNTKFNHKAL